MSLDGHKNNGLRMKTFESLEDCITFHKCTVFTLDATKRQKSFMLGSLKKPHKTTIKSHVSCCETMNGYISLLPTLQDSSLAVASTKRGMYHSMTPHWLVSYWPPVTSTGGTSTS